MSHEIEQLVDQLLLERGSYEPLLLLQHEGSLKYRHYERWRSGKSNDKGRECLDAMLSGDSADIITTLKHAAIYAKKLILQPSVVNYMGWEDAAEKPLCLSRDRQMLEYLSTTYEPSQDRFQMDLFMDSPMTSVLNGIAKALSQRNPDEAEKQLRQLEEMDSGHPQIKVFNSLLEAQRNLYDPVGNIRDELEELELRVVPLAEDALKLEARDFLVPHWWRLSEALQGSDFTPETPKLHSSYTYAHAYDWNSVRTSIEWEDGWYEHPVLLIRHVKACTMLRDEPAVYLSVFKLCWYHPKYLDSVFNGNTPSGLKLQWQFFEDDFDELDRESFPAWFLMRHSGLIGSLPVHVESEEDDPSKSGSRKSKGYRSYQLVYSLLQARQQNNDDDEMLFRKQLQEVNPDLLKVYIRSK